MSFTIEGAAVNLSETTVNFDKQIIGASSLPANIFLKNSGNLPLSIFSVVTTQDFGRVNTCTSQVNPGVTCEIDVFFQPSVVGSISGTLTIEHSAVNSPLVVDLLGEGTEIQVKDKGGPKTVTAGQIADFTLSIESTGGTGVNVSLGATNLPPFSTATFSQPNVTSDDNAPVDVTVNIATTRESSVLPFGYPNTLWPGFFVISVALFSLILWLSVISAGLSPQKTYAGAVLAILLFGVMSGCGGGSTPSPPPIFVPGTPPGIYSVVVTGTVTLGGTTTNVSTTLTLTVQ